jgi:anthranilate synthase component I
MNIYTQEFSFNADLHTAVDLYLSLRNQYRKTCLLESNDYHSRTNSKSFIGLEPIVEIIVENNFIQIASGSVCKLIPIDPVQSVTDQIQTVLHSFSFQDNSPRHNGFFGRIGFEFAMLEEDHLYKKESTLSLPEAHFILYKYIIVLDHFRDDGRIVCNSLSKGRDSEKEIEAILRKVPFTHLPFGLVGEEEKEMEDDAFQYLVEAAKKHCLRGDVFQLVLSTSFSQGFFGDDFQIYRELRRLNPSPYLFFFDFEEYRLFGSSPEAQLIIANGKAEIHPIAGTVAKTGDESIDKKQIEFLMHDEKENAEHTMLVDLARNDLSKNCTKVIVDNYKEIQHFSHLVHLVSKVTGLTKENCPFSMVSSSFPAGTLVGTPKPKALELISQFETTTRDFYGGAIGFVGAKGDLNMAIVIRSILSKNNVLHYRAGAGIVVNSIPKSEVQEVHHKLRALRQAIGKATARNSVGSKMERI